MEVVHRGLLNPSIGHNFLELIQKILLEELCLQFGPRPPLLKTKSQDAKVAELLNFFCRRLVSPAPFWLDTAQITVLAPSPLNFVKGFARFHSDEIFQEELEHTLGPDEFQVSFIIKYRARQFFQLCAIFKRVY
jgi:hypothetical protein